MTEPEVVFNMDLANGRTSARFCHMVAVLEEVELPVLLRDELNQATDDYEFIGELVDDATQALESAGFAVYWNAGDVVVWDLRPFTNDERESFYEEMFA